MTPLLALADVHFAYAPERPVLAGASLALAPGERVGLIGATGAGKSTVLWLLVGLLQAARGQVLAFGHERRREDDFREVRRRAGLVFQDPDDQLFCPTVHEDVMFGPRNLGLDPAAAAARADQALAAVGLTACADRLTHQLSGGEKRLATLAGVLAMQPDVLLLDEPTAGLDTGARQRLETLLAGLPQAMLIASHEHAFLADLTTRRLLLADGRLHPAP
jgi:cobalt/nickel transport system ATP-binding protein